jgi:hypothetical protein
VAIVCTQGSATNEHYGILRLSPATLQPVVSLFSPSSIRFESQSPYLINNYAQEGPPVAALDGDIFVGLPDCGVLMFAGNNKVELLNEETGLAIQNVQSLQALDGKLFAIVGAVWQDSGLMEIDPKTRISRILSSSRAKFKGSDLDGRSISSIAADARHHALWILTPGELFLYQPADRTVVRKTGSRGDILKAIVMDHSLQICEDKLLISGFGGCFQLDAQTEQFDVLVARTGMIYRWGKPRWQQPDFWSARPQRTILVGEGLILRDHQSLPDFQPYPFLFFRAGMSDPENLLDLCFPQQVATKLVIRDIALSPKGLLVLTDDALYLVPDLRGAQ